jgi:hypothetical protein
LAKKWVAKNGSLISSFAAHLFASLPYLGSSKTPQEGGVTQEF